MSSHASSSTSSHRPARAIHRSSSKKPEFVPSTQNRESTSLLVSMIKDVSKQVDQNSDAKRRYFSRMEQQAKASEKPRRSKRPKLDSRKLSRSSSNTSSPDESSPGSVTSQPGQRLLRRTQSEGRGDVKDVYSEPEPFQSNSVPLPSPNLSQHLHQPPSQHNKALDMSHKAEPHILNDPQQSQSLTQSVSYRNGSRILWRDSAPHSTQVKSTTVTKHPPQAAFLVPGLPASRTTSSSSSSATSAHNNQIPAVSKGNAANQAKLPVLGMRRYPANTSNRSKADTALPASQQIFQVPFAKPSQTTEAPIPTKNASFSLATGMDEDSELSIDPDASSSSIEYDLGIDVDELVKACSVFD